MAGGGLLEGTGSGDGFPSSGEVVEKRGLVGNSGGGDLGLGDRV